MSRKERQPKLGDYYKDRQERRGVCEVVLGIKIGRSPKTIADITGLSVRAVERLAKDAEQNGLIESLARQLTDEQRAERNRNIVAAVQSGKKTSEVAAQFYLDNSTVRGVCRKSGIDYVTADYRPGVPRQRTLEITAELIRGEKSFSDIAREFGCSPSRVAGIHQRIEEAGIYEAVRSRER